MIQPGDQFSLSGQAALSPAERFRHTLVRAWEKGQLGILVGVVISPLAGWPLILVGLAMGGPVGGLLGGVATGLIGAMAGLDWLVKKRKRGTGPFGKAGYSLVISLTLLVFGLGLLNRSTLTCEHIEPSRPVECRRTVYWLGLIKTEEQYFHDVRQVARANMVHFILTMGSADLAWVSGFGLKEAQQLQQFISAGERSITLQSWGLGWLAAVCLILSGGGLVWSSLLLRSAFRQLEEHLQLNKI